MQNTDLPLCLNEWVPQSVGAFFEGGYLGRSMNSREQLDQTGQGRSLYGSVKQA